MQDAGYELKTSSIPVAVDINVFDTGNLSVNNVINNVRISEKFDLTK
jgi:hypothetical protein